MVGEWYARITSGNPYAYVVVLLLLLLPMLGWGQCPYVNSTTITAATVNIGSGGIKSPDKITITHDVSVNQSATFYISGTLEITGNLSLGKSSTISICSGGTLVVRGNVALDNQSNIFVKTGGILIVLGNVDGLQGNINLDNDGKIILAGTTTLNENTSMSSSTGASYIFDPTFTPKVGTGGTVGNFDDLINNDPGLYDIFDNYVCPSAQPVTLGVNPGLNIVSGTSVTITASSATAFDSYSFYLTGASSAAQSGANNVFITPGLQNGNKVYVYASKGSCFQTASTGAFVVSAPPAKPTTPTGTTSICQGSAPSTVQTTATSGASTYSWSIVQQSGATSPGSISGTGTSATISWNPLFTGVALVRVAGVNGSGTPGPVSDDLSITVNPSPVPVLSTTTTCAGQASTLGLTAAFGTYSWSVSTANFSIASGASTATPVLGIPSNDMLFPVGSSDIVAYPDVSVTVTSGGCSATVTNNSSDKSIAVYRIPRTGASYHIGNDVAK